MTAEEAIKILDPATSHAALMTKMGGIWNQPFALALIERAQAMGLEALRAQTNFNGTQAERDTLKNAKLDRSLWKGCDICKTKGYLCGTIHIMPSLYSTQRTLFLFCPDCGRPLTEEAWAELERRMNDGKTD